MWRSGALGVQVRYKQVESLIVDDCTGGGNDTSLYKFLKKDTSLNHKFIQAREKD